MFSLNWPRVKDAPLASASFKSRPEDFRVDELFDFEFSGEGEHILLKIEKRGLTTEDVLKSLARLVNKPAKLISYAGLKDRQAVSTQWLSIHAPGEFIDNLESLGASGWRVIETARNNKKLRPGALCGNRFVVTLRELAYADDLFARVDQIKVSGVPNYFGEQRFGRNGNNLERAEEMLVQGRKIKDRFLKGIYCSSARSWLYNLILAKRVEQHTWNTPLEGDVMQLAGTNSIFAIEAADEAIRQRVTDKDISPASPLAGKGKPMASKKALQLINEIYADWQPWIQGLEKMGMEEAWRANILHVTDLECVMLDETTAELSFKLPPGCFATTVLRELVSYEE